MKLTDNRIRVIDYIYIRIYDAYIKKKDPARFAASLYMSLVTGLIFSPIPIFCAELFRTEEGVIDAIILVIYALLILICIFSTFNKKRIQQLKNNLLKSRKKYDIPTWLLFTILPISFIWTVFMYWLMLHYIIHPYHLEGILVK